MCMIVSGLAPLNLHPDSHCKELWRTALIVLVTHTHLDKPQALP